MAVKKASAPRKPKTEAKTAPAERAAAKTALPAASVATPAPVAAETEKVEAVPSKPLPAVQTPKESFKKAAKPAFPGYGELVSANQENLDAVVKAGSVMVHGMEIFSRELMTFAQASAEANAAVATRLFGVKSLQEAVDLQNAHARDSFDKTVAETSKLTEMSVKVASEAFEPLQARVNVAVEKLLKSQAA